MRILNITKRKDTQNNSYCLRTHTPYSHHWVLLRKLIVFLSDLFNSLSIIEAEWWIYVSVRKNIGWDNGLSPDRWQAIIWTNAGILLLVIGSVGTNFSEILIEIHIFSFKKMHLKMSPGKCQPFCLGLNVFIMYKKNLTKCFPKPGEWRTTPPTGGLHCINHRPDHHRMRCWTKPACPMWQGMWDLRYELHAESLLQKKENQ